MKQPLIYTTAILVAMFGQAQDLPTMHYHLDILSNQDTIYVTLELKGDLDRKASIFQFAATAPGTYQTMNIGRYVSDFVPVDKNGNALEVKRKSVNQFEIDKPHKVASITYAVAETFDTQVEELPIYLMCGTSLEEDHVLLNAHDYMGYFEGYQASPVRLDFNTKPAWTYGTALKAENNVFSAESFDHAVDSPILIGELTYADTLIGDTPIEIYTYSANDLINSEMLLQNMSDMLGAAREFLVELPVDRYTFLYHFEPSPPGRTGAWEHSYSSEYVLGEEEPTEAFMVKVTDIASHEFFHIVTPLNIHSEIVEEFNFVSPTPSVHLWLYEGVTEWASNILLYRGGVITLEEYLKNAIAFKIMVSEKYFDNSWSLKRISDESFTTGADQYSNIYYQGSLIAGLLDIRLLELSDGQYGLREMVLELVDKYGKGKPVSEETFFDDLAAMTYPEIRDFFDDYVIDSKRLPLKAYYEKIGIKVKKDKKKGWQVEKMENLTEGQQKLFDAWSGNMEME